MGRSAGAEPERPPLQGVAARSPSHLLHQVHNTTAKRESNKILVVSILPITHATVPQSTEATRCFFGNACCCRRCNSPRNIQTSCAWYDRNRGHHIENSYGTSHHQTKALGRSLRQRKGPQSATHLLGAARITRLSGSRGRHHPRSRRFLQHCKCSICFSS